MIDNKFPFPKVYEVKCRRVFTVIEVHEVSAVDANHAKELVAKAKSSVVKKSGMVESDCIITSVDRVTDE